jgi:hypothetical protein
VVERTVISTADIHARATPDRFEPLKNLDFIGGIVFRRCVGKEISHAHSPGKPYTLFLQDIGLEARTLYQH